MKKRRKNKRKKKTDWSAYIFVVPGQAKEKRDGRVIGARERAKRKLAKEGSAVEGESTLSKRIGAVEPDLNPVYGAPWSPRLDKTKFGEPLKPSAFRLLKHKAKKK